MDGPLLKDIFVPLKGHPGIIGGDLCISGGHDLYGRRRAKLSREEKVLLAADSYKQEVARTSAQPLIKNSILQGISEKWTGAFKFWCRIIF